MEEILYEKRLNILMRWEMIDMRGKTVQGAYSYIAETDWWSGCVWKPNYKGERLQKKNSKRRQARIMRERKTKELVDKIDFLYNNERPTGQKHKYTRLDDGGK